MTTTTPRQPARQRPRSSLRRIIRVFRPKGLLLFVSAFFVALFDGLSLWMVVPFLRKSLSESSAAQANQPGLLSHLDNATLLALLIFFFSVKIAFHFLHDKYLLIFQWRTLERWKHALMRSYLYSDYLDFVTRDHGKLLNDLGQETQVASGWLRDIVALFLQVCFVAVLFVIILLTSWVIGLALLLTGVASMLINVRMKRDNKEHMGQNRLRLRAKAETTASENILSFRQIKLFSLEGERLERYQGDVRALSDLLLDYMRSKRIIAIIPQVLVSCLLIAAFIYLRFSNGVSIASIVPHAAFLLLVIQRLFPALSQMVTTYTNVRLARPSLDLVQRTIAAGNARMAPTGGAPVERIAGEIAFRDVSYTFPGKEPLFQRINLTISEHKITALVGLSGSGKSTLADLLVGLLRANSGTVLINGLDIGQLDVDSLRRRIGYVSQDTALFNATIRENLLVGRPDATEDEIVAACRRAHASKFIEALPQGYETRVGERGVLLSGGERQRLAIARALLRDPDLFIFDEATSALDIQTEAVIHEMLVSLRGHKTVLLITHRLQLAEHADQIYLVHEGQIRKLGSPDEIPESLAMSLREPSEPIKAL